MPVSNRLRLLLPLPFSCLLSDTVKAEPAQVDVQGQQRAIETRPQWASGLVSGSWKPLWYSFPPRSSQNSSVEGVPLSRSAPVGAPALGRDVAVQGLPVHPLGGWVPVTGWRALPFVQHCLSPTKNVPGAGAHTHTHARAHFSSF